MAVKCGVGLLVLCAVSTWTEAYTLKGVKIPRGDNNDLTVSEQLEKANKNLRAAAGRAEAAGLSSPQDDPTENMVQDDGIQIKGDIVLPNLPTLRMADMCVLHGCLWPKAPNGNVYIPYVIANHYTPEELDLIERSMTSFSNSTCVQFIPRTNQGDFLYIQSLSGCYSYVGRQGNVQTVSLNHQGCLSYGVIQHELLHALGFDHEHCRNDRDQHIRVLLKNVIIGKEHNFRKVGTLNQRTPYDYSSVLHYGRRAFSRDNNPTLVAIPSPDTVFGEAKQMSQGDIDRIKLLYCKN